MAPRDKTACQTFPCKCKTCIFSVESDVYNKKKIQMFVVNMTFISSREVKKCIFHSCLRHSWNIHFFTSLDEIKVIFTPNIWISSIYYYVKSVSMKIQMAKCELTFPTKYICSDWFFSMYKEHFATCWKFGVCACWKKKKSVRWVTGQFIK